VCGLSEEFCKALRPFLPAIVILKRGGDMSDTMTYARWSASLLGFIF
jgi:hypothetical protein